jgi:hypothetical protein
MFEIRVVLQDGIDRFYLLRVERRDLDVYCFVPKLGAHFSRHRSGESHFRQERKSLSPDDQPPVIMIGPAGEVVPNGILEAPLADPGSASRICTAVFPIRKPVEDFQRFGRKTVDCFIIDARMLPKDTTGLEIGVWAVRERNKISFEWDHRDIPADMVHKVTKCAPQIWVYARPAQGSFH